MLDEGFVAPFLCISPVILVTAGDFMLCLSMFEVLGINVPGHVVKLQKCLQKLRSDACHSGSTESGFPSQSAVKDQQPAKMHKVESRQASEYLQVQYL